jgi:dihydrofolate reductase
MGSSRLTRSLIEEELVDEYRLMLHPVVLGGCKRLFRDGAPMQTLRLMEAAVTTSGLATLTYRPDRS